MDTQLKYPQNTECILNIENIQLKIWVEKSFGAPSDDQHQALPSEPYASRTMHRHSHAEIFCCPCGFLHINTDSQIIQLDKGDIAVIPGGLQELTHTGNIGIGGIVPAEGGGIVLIHLCSQFLL